MQALTELLEAKPTLADPMLDLGFFPEQMKTEEMRNFFSNSLPQHYAKYRSCYPNDVFATFDELCAFAEENASVLPEILNKKVYKKHVASVVSLFRLARINPNILFQIPQNKMMQEDIGSTKDSEFLEFCNLNPIAMGEAICEGVFDNVLKDMDDCEVILSCFNVYPELLESCFNYLVSLGLTKQQKEKYYIGNFDTEYPEDIRERFLMIPERNIIKPIKLRLIINQAVLRRSLDSYVTTYDSYVTICYDASGNVVSEASLSAEDTALIALLSEDGLDSLESGEKNKELTLSKLAVLLIANPDRSEYILQHIDIVPSKEDVKVILYLLKNYSKIASALCENNDYVKSFFIRPSNVVKLLSQEPLLHKHREAVVELHAKTAPAYLSKMWQLKALKNALRSQESHGAKMILAWLHMKDRETEAEAFSLLSAIPASSPYFPEAKEYMMLIAKAYDRDQSRVVSFALQTYSHPASTAQMKEDSKMAAWHGLILLGYMGSEADIYLEFDKDRFTQCSEKFLQEAQESICKFDLKGLTRNAP